MGKTQNLQLSVLPTTEESTKIARDFMRELGSDKPDSNMQIIDRAFGELDERSKTKEIWSTEQPTGQAAGDVWHKIIVRNKG